MGCDIHAFIDYDDFVKQDGEIYVSCFATLHLRRNYNLFGLMAGVRYQELKLFEPRGLPKNLSYQTKDANQLFVSDEPNVDFQDGFCSRQSAERWVAWGDSYWIGTDQKLVSHPDWHTHSYLLQGEMEQVLRKLEHDSKAEIRAIVSCMNALNGNNPQKSRLVFWFDN